MSADVLAAALEAYDAGLCPIRPSTDGTKQPLGNWKCYQTARPERDEVVAGSDRILASAWSAAP